MQDAVREEPTAQACMLAEIRSGQILQLGSASKSLQPHQSHGLLELVRRRHKRHLNITIPNASQTNPKL